MDYSKKSVPKLKEIAQRWFNDWIRLRDTDDHGMGRCISSGRLLQYGTANAQAGHYFSRGQYPSLAFHEDNVHLQSRSDNYFKSGNLLEYREALIKKIGQARFEKLEKLALMSKRSSFKWDRIELIEVIKKYKAKVKELKKTKV